MIYDVRLIIYIVCGNEQVRKNTWETFKIRGEASKGTVTSLGVRERGSRAPGVRSTGLLSAMIVSDVFDGAARRKDLPLTKR